MIARLAGRLAAIVALYALSGGDTRMIEPGTQERRGSLVAYIARIRGYDVIRRLGNGDISVVALGACAGGDTGMAEAGTRPRNR